MENQISNLENQNKEKYGYIYITENLINGNKYIGKHKHNKNNKYYLGSGKLLKLAIKKYGKKSFKLSILEYCSSPEELNEKEQYWINYYNAVKDPNFYNITPGGDAIFYNYAPIEEQLRVRKVVSEKLKSRVVSEETKKKHYIAYQNQPEEYKESLKLKLLSVNKGRKSTKSQLLTLASAQSKNFIINLNMGNIFNSNTEASFYYDIPKHLQFQKGKSVAFHYNFYWLKLHKNNIKEIDLNFIEEEISNYFINKLIYCEDLDLIFENVKEVGDYFGKKDLSCIRSCLNNASSKVYGYHLIYCSKSQILNFIKIKFNIDKIYEQVKKYRV